MGSLAVETEGELVVVTMATLDGTSIRAELDQDMCNELIVSLLQANMHAFHP